MLRTLGLLLLPLLLLATPASALTSKQKMETCKIGAQAQHLTGAKRTAFIKSCMRRAPAYRVTYKQKLKTCEMGAKDLKYTGAKRSHFIKRCMGKGDYEPAARRALKKNTMKKNAMKKPAMKKPTMKQN